MRVDPEGSWKFGKQALPLRGHDAKNQIRILGGSRNSVAVGGKGADYHVVERKPVESVKQHTYCGLTGFHGRLFRLCSSLRSFARRCKRRRWTSSSAAAGRSSRMPSFIRSQTPENSRIPARIFSSPVIIRACLTFASRAKRASSAIRSSMAGKVAGRMACCKLELQLAAWLRASRRARISASGRSAGQP